MYHPLVKEVFGGDEDLPDYVRTAHQIDPYFRVRMQGVIQKYTDSSISSTINLPEDIDVETVADIYITAYKEGLKGVTVYREGSREGILQTEGQDDKKEENGGAETAGATSADGFHHVRHRPAVTQGITERINTGEGRIYVTINEDEFGICEVFSTIGKAGGNAAAQSEAVSRLISLALRSGVDPQEVVSELKGISGPNPVWENGELILSTPDAIGKAIERYVQRRAGGDAVVDVSAEPQAVSLEPPTQDSSNGVKTSTTCPECGSTVAHENSCLMCKHCGWSKC